MLRKIFTASVLSIGFIMTPIASVNVSASPQIFENMTGSFRGKGLVKTSIKSKKESIRCRLKGTPNGDKKIKMTGNCAVSGFIFSLNGFIEQTGSNAYRANMFRSLANLKQSNFSGKRSGTRINFSFNAKDRITKQNVKAKINLTAKSATSFDVSISRTDPKSGKIFSVGTIKFAKR